MRTFARLLLPLALVASAVLFCNVAFAADATGPDSPQSLAALWPMIGLMIATAAGWGIPKLAAKYSFFHTAAGAIVLGFIGAVIASVTPIFQAGKVTWAALAWAAVGGGTAFFARLNPSTTADQPAAKSPAAAKLGVLLPIAFVLAMAMPGCTTTGGAALGTCELGSLPATLEAVVAEVVAIAMNPASVVSDLEALGGKIGPAQFSCAVQAVEAWLAGQSSATSSRLMAGVGENQRQHALAVMHDYLGKHPATACGNLYAPVVKRVADMTPADLYLKPMVAKAACIFGAL